MSERVNALQGVIQPAGFAPLPSDWHATSTTVQADDGTRLFLLTLAKKERPTRPRALMIVHGLGEHGGRYLHFAAGLHAAVDEIHLMDLRGHGRSEGVRGHTASFQQYADDVTAVLRTVALGLPPGGALHLFAHSMGGLIGALMLQRHADLPLRSVTLSSPLLGVSVKIPWIKSMAGKILARLWSDVQMTNEIDASGVSRDPAVVDAYLKDRLNHNKVTPSWFVSMNETLAKVNAVGPTWNYPTQFLVPLDERIVDAHATLAFAGRQPSARVIQYPDSRHESFNDFGKEQVFMDVSEWILKHA